MNPLLASRKCHSNGLGVQISTRDDGAGSYFSIDFDPFQPGDEISKRLGRATVVTLRSDDVQKAEEQADNLVREKTPHRCSDGCSEWIRVADSN
jgi:hypothetical protein